MTYDVVRCGDALTASGEGPHSRGWAVSADRRSGTGRDEARLVRRATRTSWIRVMGQARSSGVWWTPSRIRVGNVPVSRSGHDGRALATTGLGAGRPGSTSGRPGAPGAGLLATRPDAAGGTGPTSTSPSVGARGYGTERSVLVAAPRGEGWLVDDAAVDDGGRRRSGGSSGMRSPPTARRRRPPGVPTYDTDRAEHATRAGLDRGRVVVAEGAARIGGGQSAIDVALPGADAVTVGAPPVYAPRGRSVPAGTHRRRRGASSGSRPGTRTGLRCNRGGPASRRGKPDATDGGLGTTTALRLLRGRRPPDLSRPPGHSTGRPSPRAMSIRWTSEVPSPISRTLASR